MKTKVTLKEGNFNTIQLDPEVGNYYRNTSSGDLYILTCYNGKFWLNNVTYGSIYVEPNEDINKVFGNSEAFFKLITKVEIKI